MKMGISKVTAKGQVTIPLAIREEQGIKEGTPLLFESREGEMVVKRTEDWSEGLRELREEVKKMGLTREDVLKMIKDIRRERVKHSSLNSP